MFFPWLHHEVSVINMLFYAMGPAGNCMAASSRFWLVLQQGARGCLTLESFRFLQGHPSYIGVFLPWNSLIKSYENVLEFKGK
jgi:hypothetical protein